MISIVNGIMLNRVNYKPPYTTVKLQRYSKIDHDNYIKSLKHEIDRLSTKAGVNYTEFIDNSTMPGIVEIKKIQAELKGYSYFNDTYKKKNYHLFVYSITRELMFFGDMSGARDDLPTSRIYLLFHRNHFDLIINFSRFFSIHEPCSFCKKSFTSPRFHRNCVYVCKCCFRSPPCDTSIDLKIKCRDCNRNFLNGECFRRHEATICKNYKICNECNRVMKNDHDCTSFYCRSCVKMQPYEHVHMIPVYKPKNFKVKQHFFIFFDYETVSIPSPRGGNEQIANMLVSQIICDLCINVQSNEYDCRFCGERTKIFEYAEDDLTKRFLKYVYAMADGARVTLIGHNSSGFDAHFLLKSIYETNENTNIKCIFNGTKIMCLSIGDRIRVIDSLHFFPTSLAKLPKMFNLDIGLSKGIFPYLFNKFENLKYIGKFPHIKYYNPDSMKPDERETFLVWYSERKDNEFDMKSELIKYCKSDVEILRKSCIKFHLSILSEFEIRVFEETLTLASLVNKIYRKNFYDGRLAIIGDRGVRLRQNQSKIGLKFILFTEKKYKTTLQSTLRGNEKIIQIRNKKYYIDAYLERDREKICFEFDGCW